MGKAKGQIYNAGLSTKFRENKDKDPLQYVEDVFAGREQPNVPAFFQREMMAFRVPTIGTVEMYINPQNFVINSKKQITEVRTKGGYVMQYWGEHLDEIQISGTTGSSGIEGINILREIYRSEHQVFSSVGATMKAKLEGSLNALLANSLNQSSFGREVNKWLNLNVSTRPTLASIASAIELIFQGVMYKGYFTSFRVTERAEQPGIFEYDMQMKSYFRRGLRTNFLSFHRSPHHGPANSDSFVPSYDRAAEGVEPSEVIQQFLNKENQ